LALTNPSARRLECGKKEAAAEIAHRAPVAGRRCPVIVAATSRNHIGRSPVTRTPSIAATTRRRVLQAVGAAGALAFTKVPVFAQATPIKLVFAHVTPPPESSAVAFAAMAEEVTKRSNGELLMEFHGGTLLTKELEIINAVKAGNIAIGDPGGAAATVFPEMGVFLVPYLIASYDQAYKMFNGQVGDRLDQQFQDKYKLKVLFFYDYGFRHFWNTKRPINEPKDLRGLKMRVQQAKVFADTINGLGGVAVPMAWGEVIPAAQSGVIDGADLPIVNILALKAYEVSKYCSMTFHNYGPTAAVINLDIWNRLTAVQQKLLQEASHTAQATVRQLTESVDNLAKAKELLEPKGMTVNPADVEAFRRVAQEKVWPAYKQQFPELWEEIVATKV
jgi:tripartite ATP-independent transporter DctP family solute receptor